MSAAGEPGARHNWGRTDTRHFALDLPVPPRPARTPVAGLVAGAAEVDLTPPPGMPKSGHSRNAVDGNGFRTRLRARAIHLASGETSVVLLACDLLAGSAVVQRTLADELADLVPVEGLFMGVTHTHAGPGQYAGSEFYNRWASNRSGFDPGYTRFLVDQLASAVRSAVEGRRPARIAIGSTDVWGFTRNRALGAYVRNDDVSDRRDLPHRRYAAIDPRLHLLRVDDDEGPVAAYSWFSIHGTGIRSSDPSYNADVWAYLNGELANRVQAATGRRPVAGAAVASHGDMTPAVRPGMLVFPEAERVGRGIGEAAAKLHAELGAELSADVPIRTGLRELDLADHPEVDGIILPPPRVGAAKLAGADENTTPVIHRIPPFRAGLGRRPRGDHQEKRVVAGEVAHRRFAPPHAFPLLLPLHLVSIGDTTVVGLPFEVTVEAGRRIAAAAVDGATQGRAGSGIRHAFVASLVDDHCDYLTTAEEYTAQYYEGASTLFGPRQQAFVAGAVRELATEVVAAPASEPVVDVRPRTFRFTVRDRLLRPTGARADRVLGVPRFVEATPTEDTHWEQPWTDVAPGDLEWHRPLVRVEADGPDGWTVVDDDQGWHVGVSYVGAHSGQHRYVTRWYRPPLGRPGLHRFALVANGGQPEVAGPAFD